MMYRYFIRLLIAFSILGLMACDDVVEVTDETDTGTTTGTDATDESDGDGNTNGDSGVTDRSAEVTARAKAYLARQIENIRPGNTSTTGKPDYFNVSHHDQYGLVLTVKKPGDESGGAEYIGSSKGEALFVNTLALASYCMLQQQDASYGLTDRISQLWDSIKTNLISSGLLIRHPDKSGDAIDKQSVAATMYLGAIAHKTSCAPVKDEFKDSILVPVISKETTASPNWSFGTGSELISVLERDLVYMTAKIYGISNNLGMDGNLDVNESSVNSVLAGCKLSAPFICPRTIALVYPNGTDEDPATVTTLAAAKAYRLDYAAAAAAAEKTVYEVIKAAGAEPNDSVSTDIHTNFLRLIIAHVEAETNGENAMYTTAEVMEGLAGIVKVGEGYAPNALYKAAHNKLRNADQKPLLLNLFNEWSKPVHLPTNNDSGAIANRGCTDYQWQRLPLHTCKNSLGASDENYLDLREYTGVDFIHARAWAY